MIYIYKYINIKFKKIDPGYELIFNLLEQLVQTRNLKNSAFNSLINLKKKRNIITHNSFCPTF